MKEQNQVRVVILTSFSRVDLDHVRCSISESESASFIVWLAVGVSQKSLGNSFKTLPSVKAFFLPRVQGRAGSSGTGPASSPLSIEQKESFLRKQSTFLQNKVVSATSSLRILSLLLHQCLTDRMIGLS